MAVINYPLTLPLPNDGDFKEQLLETKVRDEGEVGSARLRNRFTRALKRFSFTLVLTETEKTALETFYLITLARGVEIFNWTHPVTTIVYEVIMVRYPQPTHRRFNQWNVAIELEEV